MKRRELRATSAEIAISLLMFTGQIEGRALHYDTPIPPAKGPQRTLILHNRGVEQLHTAKTLYSKACDQLGCPRHHRLDSPHAPWWVYKPTRPGRDTRCTNGRGQHGDTEALARQALNSAVRAFQLAGRSAGIRRCSSTDTRDRDVCLTSFWLLDRIAEWAMALAVSRHHGPLASRPVRRFYCGSHMLNMPRKYHVRPMSPHADAYIRGHGTGPQQLPMRF
jgi:hypothetical protein